MPDALLARQLAAPDGRAVMPALCNLAMLRAQRPPAYGLVLPLACLRSVLTAGRAGHASGAPSAVVQPRPARLRTAGPAAQPPPGVIATYAGGLNGAVGPPTAFGMTPFGVTLDGTGRLLIADMYNSVVWLADLTASSFTAFGQIVPADSIVVVAGDGSFGYGGDGELATQAELWNPSGMALDGAGNLYIADINNHRVREVLASTGVITTVAGDGASGYSGDGGPATQAEVGPNSIALDGAGNLYIADSNNNRIREVLASTGIITTVAGNGSAGYSGDGGLATGAELNFPYGVTLDGSDNLFITDTSNNRVREVLATTGVITTVVGDGSFGYSGDGGPATRAELYSPIGVALDGVGNLYITDYFNNRIREVLAATGIITTVAGNGASGYYGDGGPATQAALNYPVGVALDGVGNLYIADDYSNRVREVLAATGIITTVAGNGSYSYSGDGGLATQAEVSPSSVALDEAGNLYIADAINNRVREVLASTGIITTVAGNGSAGYSGDGGLATGAELNFPYGVVLDGAGDLYIADAGNNRVREVVASTGIVTTVAGNGTNSYGGDGGPATQAELNYPSGVALDGAGNLYIADDLNNRVREVLIATGIITTVAGNGSYGYGGDGGPATQAELSYLAGMTLDRAGNLYIADGGNNRIREVLARTGVITTVAGNGSPGCPDSGPCYGGDGGLATLAELYSPHGVALDGGGNLYITDDLNNRVREVLASTGIITTVVGNGSAGYSGDGGPATQAEAALGLLSGVALDGAGTLYFAAANRVRVVGPPAPAAIAVNPASGAVSQTFNVTGANFGPDEPVNVYWDSTTTSPLTSATTAADGSFAVTLTVPQAIAGTHMITATGQTSSRAADASFVVAPTAFLAAISGAQGSHNNVTGNGFGTSEKVTAYWQSSRGRCWVARRPTRWAPLPVTWHSHSRCHSAPQARTQSSVWVSPVALL